MVLPCNLPMAFVAISVNHTAPSDPRAMPPGCAPSVGTTNSLILPAAALAGLAATTESRRPATDRPTSDALRGSRAKLAFVMRDPFAFEVGGRQGIRTKRRP